MSRRAVRPKPCACCGTTFLPRTDRANPYCSRLCASTGRRKAYVVKNGYRFLLQPTHHRADSYGYVREHIVVAESVLGRQLTSHERVHHRNGNKQDNRAANIEVMESNSEHMRAHHGDALVRARALRWARHHERQVSSKCPGS